MNGREFASSRFSFLRRHRLCIARAFASGGGERFLRKEENQLQIYKEHLSHQLVTSTLTSERERERDCFASLTLRFQPIRRRCLGEGCSVLCDHKEQRQADSFNSAHFISPLTCTRHFPCFVRFRPCRLTAMVQRASEGPTQILLLICRHLYE